MIGSYLLSNHPMVILDVQFHKLRYLLVPQPAIIV